jgi:hypothetical protein
MDFSKTNFKKYIHHNPIDRIDQNVRDYYCWFNVEQKVMAKKLTLITQDFCDGGGGACSTCSDGDD